MIVDHRTYRVKPGCVPAQLAIYEKYAFDLQVRYLGKPIAFLTAESGELNTMTHLWAYDSAADREQRRAAMAKDPDWATYLKANVDGGYIVDQRTCLMVPAKFAPIVR